MFNKNIKNASAKLAFFSTQPTFNNFNKFFKTSVYPFKNWLVTRHVGFGFPTNHFMLDFTDEIVTRLIPSGIIQHSIKFLDWCRYRDSIGENLKVPKILSMEDLSFGFVLWLNAGCFALFVFLMETFAVKIWQILTRVSRIFCSFFGFINGTRERLGRI